MKAPAWLTARPFAHRGLFDTRRPENSLSAVDAAMAAGYPVEVDVQVTADGRAVVFHDWSLKRLTGCNALVREKTLSDLRDLRLGDSTEAIPTLEDVLDLVAGRQPVLIEIKNRKRPTALEPDVARVVAAYRGPCAIHSFNPFTLGWFRRRHPEILRGQISCAFDTDDMAHWKKLILANYGMNWLSRPHFISHHWARLPAVAPAILRRHFRLPLLTWTVRSAEEESIARRHSDNIIFEAFRPAVG